ncbi:phosphate ABC transporter permease PstA [Dongia deserti]|uniref:phosphate ABC transporter permease PstA n=1 Tax=Dongia deserti TaxID=2268030 RepID=UPI002546CF6E|nr:phosphate ABC transporter permease PstA [Dongia deserti]
MTDVALIGSASETGVKLRRPDLSEDRIRRRYAAERRFRLYGMLAIGFAVFMLGFLAVTVVLQGYTAFWQTRIVLDVNIDPAEVDPQNTRLPESLWQGNYQAVVREALRSLFPEVESRGDRRALNDFLSNAAGDAVRRMVMENPALVGTTQRVEVLAADEIDMLAKGRIDRDVPATDRPIDDQQLGWFDKLEAEGRIVSSFNLDFFTTGDSREPEQAGVGGALVGSLLTILTAIILSLPISVAAAIYLEEFAPKNRITDIIEININNLAAVPSIVFGLLGLAVLLGFFGLPRGAPLVGGMVLSLMTLPTIIIATRAALKAVPPSIREAAYGVGASKQQVVMHHVLPLAMPGIMTGAIIGTARAMGESAAVLMIGMVAFIVDIPTSITDPATVLPVQIFLWADAPERAFVERTSAGIMVMLVFLVLMNAAAVVIRRRFERRW